MVPCHWGITGRPDAWSPKSYMTVLSIPLFMIGFNIIMYVIYNMIERLRSSIDPDNIEKSKEQNRIFRYIWSIFCVLLNLILNIIFAIINLNALGVINFKPAVMIALTIPMLLLVVISIIMSLLMGQGGSRIKIVHIDNTENKVIDRDDDKYWILGNFYYNSDDPSLFVEKRIGTGWSFNCARPLAMIVIGLCTAMLIAMVIFSILMIH